TPADRFVAPSDFELFLFGAQKGLTPFMTPEDRALMSVDPAKGGLAGNYGHVLHQGAPHAYRRPPARRQRGRPFGLRHGSTPPGRVLRSRPEQQPGLPGRRSGAAVPP